MSRVFISYVRENSATVRRLADVLSAFDIRVWLDRDQLGAGARWRTAIRQAIADGDFFIACFSAESLERAKSYMNEELTLAIEELRQRGTNRAWFIPVLLNECEVPDRDIGAGETLRSLQWVILYEDWEEGVRQILSTVEPQSGRLYQLQRGLTDQSARVRIHAADDLGKMGSLAREAVPALTELLEDPNETVRAAAAAALGSIGAATAEVVAKLLRVIIDGEYYSTEHAVSALAKLGIAAVPTFLEWARKYPEIAEQTGELLSEIDDPAVVPTLVEAARGGSWDAIVSLGRIGREANAAVPLLIELVNQKSDQWDAIEALGGIGDPRALPVLAEQLSASNARTRYSAVAALGRIGERSTIPLIENALQDNDADVRSHALAALASLGGEEVVPLLAMSLADESWVVRWEAAKALGKVGNPSAAQPLIRSLSDSDPNVVAAVAESLGMLRQMEAVAALIETLRHETDRVRSSVVNALLAIGTPEAVQAVRGLGE